MVCLTPLFEMVGCLKYNRCGPPIHKSPFNPTIKMEIRITEGKHTLIVMVKVADQRERVREQKGKRKGNGSLKRREEIKEETVTIVGAQDMQVRSVLSDQLGL